MVEGAVGAIFLKREELGGKCSVFEEKGSRKDVQNVFKHVNRVASEAGHSR